jgi:hypothetical protein
MWIPIIWKILMPVKDADKLIAGNGMNCRLSDPADLPKVIKK